MALFLFGTTSPRPDLVANPALRSQEGASPTSALLPLQQPRGWRDRGRGLASDWGGVRLLGKVALPTQLFAATLSFFSESNMQ